MNQDSFCFQIQFSNISFGAKRADMSNIVKVSKYNIHNEIINFNDKYNTLLGKRSQFKWRSKQRLCMADIDKKSKY